jgi:hypothetical protein
MSQSLETRLFSAHLPLLHRGHTFQEPQPGVGADTAAGHRPPASIERSRRQKRQAEHLAPEMFLNRHGIWVYPAPITHSEIMRGRRRKLVPRMALDPQGQWVPKDSLPAPEFYRNSEGDLRTEPSHGPLPKSIRYSRDAQGQWRRGYESLRALVDNSELSLSLAPDAAEPRPRPESFRKMVRNAAGEWEHETV